jgi:hypothetical protein
MTTTRREQLKNAGRAAVVVALGAVGIHLATRPGRAVRSSCDRSGTCKGCGSVEQCVRPEAMSYREVRT